MSSFEDLDPAELTLGKPVTAMTDTELVSYLKVAIKQAQDIDLVVKGNPERAIMANLKSLYGQRAGLIVKWAIWHHGGKFRDDLISHRSFTKGRKWFTDKLDWEMQDYVKRQALQEIENRTAMAALARLEDL